MNPTLRTEEAQMKRALTLLCGIALAGCAGMGGGEAKGSATADLMSADGRNRGTATFTEAAGKVRIVVDVSGLNPGKHGIHIHAIGLCRDPAFTSAGGHFNPGNKKHGLDSPEGAHGGDLPNLEAGKDGKAHYDVTTDRVTLSSGSLSLFDADGSALVIHDTEDDQKTDPAGNSGARVVCGAIRQG
jgi:Cu-Zn family superoxide dismutase